MPHTFKTIFEGVAQLAQGVAQLAQQVKELEKQQKGIDKRVQKLEQHSKALAKVHRKIGKVGGTTDTPSTVSSGSKPQSTISRKRNIEEINSHEPASKQQKTQ